MKHLLLMACLIVYISSSCHPLCLTNCGSANCPACYSSFLSIALPSSKTCNCPQGYFQDSTSLCLFCPVNCNQCTNATACTSCIDGYQLTNNYTCTPNYFNTGGWVSMFIADDFNDLQLRNKNVAGYSVVINSSLSQNNSTITANDFSSCRLIPSQYFFGINLLGYQSKISHTYFGLPPHQWAQVRFQFVAIDQWQGESLILTIYQGNYIDSSNTAPQISFLQSFNSSQRFQDFCGSTAYADNLGIMDGSFQHYFSSLSLSVRTSLANSATPPANARNIFFAVRQIFVRVGSCQRNCLTCSSFKICLQCRPPYTLSTNSTCVCVGPLGFPSKYGCQPACSAGYVQSQSSLNCVSCDSQIPNCQLCTGNNSVVTCSKCSPGKFFWNGSCQTNCPQGTRQMQSVPLNNTTTQDQCVPCSIGCQTCQGEACLLCFPGRAYYNGSCGTACPTNTYLDVFGVCNPCPFGCLTCSSSIMCLSCPTISKLVNGQCVPYCFNTAILSSATTNACNITCATGCATCFGTTPSQCLSCSTDALFDNACGTCPAGTFNSNSVCVSCPAACSNCTASICTVCTQGYYLTNGQCIRSCPISTQPINLICVNCPANCVGCYTGLCLQCAQGFSLFEGGCLAGNNCPTSYYFDKTHEKCLPCYSNCVSCVKSLCYQCTSGYYLEGSECLLACSPQKTPILTNITLNGVTSTVGVCKWKSQVCGVYSNDKKGSCLQCTSTYPTQLLVGAYCAAACLTGFGFNSGVCVACPANCMHCVNGQCYQCLYNYVLNAVELVSSSQVCVLNYCATNYFSDSLQCQKCPDGCQVCQMDGSCLACSASYVLIASVCVNSQCSQVNQYYNLTTLGCSTCDPSCRSCSSLLSCTSCLNQYLYQSSCIPTCPTGYFPDSLSSSCRKCNPKCQTCNSISNCLTCISQFYLLGFYSPNNALCVDDCTMGFFPDTNTGICTRCYQDCQSCFGPSQYHCLTCYGNFYLDDNKCVYACSVEKYVDNEDHCDWCHPSCFSCQGPADYQCTTCKDGQYFYMNTCYKYLCPSGTYLADVDRNTCEDCQFGCQICSSPYFCSICINGYYLYQSWCYLSKCPFNTFPAQVMGLGGVCQSCSQKLFPNCIECMGSSCTLCASPYYLYPQGQFVTVAGIEVQCVTACPVGFYPQGQMCLRCFTDCLSCTGVSSCTSCSAGTILIDGVCSNSCPASTFLNGLTCQPCSLGCLSCTSLTNCSACLSKSGLYFNNVTCTSTCPTGYFPDFLNSICLPCFKNCATCASLYTCIQCSMGYTLKNGSCQNLVPCSVPNCHSCLGSNCAVCTPGLSLLVTRNGQQCTATCPIGFISVLSICVRCNSTCDNCSLNINNCISCKTGMYLLQGSCFNKCPVGTYSMDGACAPCGQGCYRCTCRLCLSCHVPYLYLNGSCVLSCPISTFPDPSLTYCWNCKANCMSCKSRLSCDACSSLYYLSNENCVRRCASTTYSLQTDKTMACIPCMAPCFTCLSPTVCTSCMSSFSLSGTSCVMGCPDGTYSLYITALQDPIRNSSLYAYACKSCSYKCLTCVTSASNCVQCAKGYVLSTQSCVSSCPASTFLLAGICVQCPQSCIQCSTASNCSICAPATVNAYGICLSHCPAAMYPKVASNQASLTTYCNPCNSPCLTCRGPTQYDCLTCVNGTYFFSGKCFVTCPVGSYADPTAICISCSFGCQACTTMTACSLCMLNFTLTAGSCVPNNLLPCTILNCLACNGSTCELCLENTYLYSSACVTTCPVSTFALRGICLPCSANCLSCTPSACLICNNLTYLYQSLCVTSCPYSTLAQLGQCSLNPCLSYINSTCLKCLSPYLLSNGACVTTCSIGTLSIASTCVPCPNGCSACDTSTQCTACAASTPPRYLFMGQCIYDCPLTTYTNGGNCVKCSDPKCYSCSGNSTIGSETCQVCRPTLNYFLFNGTCMRQCPNGFFANSINNKCVICPAFCLTCRSITYCLTCLVSAVLSTGGICSPHCANGQFKQGLICMNCPPTCNSCSNLTSCTGCNGGNILVDGFCVTRCPSSAYLTLQTSSLYSNSNSYSCATCLSPCLTCLDATTCISCVIPYALSGSSCVTACPLGQYILKGLNKCSLCSPLCLTCVNASNICTSCFSGYVLDTMSNCVSNCTIQQFYNPTSGACLSCAGSCYSCFGALSTNCLSCIVPSLLLHTQCVAVCPAGSYASTSYECLPCDATKCVTCSSLSICTSCRAQQVLQGGVCGSNCSAGMYLTNGQCINCSPGCATCNQTTCLSCIAGYYNLQTRQCVTQCPVSTIPILNVCQPCSPNCLLCSSSACIACQVPLLLYMGQCMTVCPPSYYTQGSTCVSCLTLPNCLNCLTAQTGEIQCINCIYPYLLLTDTHTCVLACPSNYSFDGSSSCNPTPACGMLVWNSQCIQYCPSGTFSNNVTCVQCGPLCRECSSLLQCSVCSNGVYLSGGICVAICPSGSYSQDNYCLSCPSPCSTCFTSTTGVQCSACLSNYYFHNANCVSACPTSTFPSTPTFPSTAKCLLCGPTCLACSSSSVCTTCLNSMSIPPDCLNTQCSPNQYRAANSTCQPCSSLCNTCSGPLSTQCLSCSSGVLISSTCRTSCPSGYYVSGSTCVACTTQCAACNATACLACLNLYYLSPDATQCVPSCRQLNTATLGYYQQGTACKACSPSCLSCTASACTACTPTYFLYLGTCVSSCPTSAFAANGVCINCEPQCTSCNATQCNTCSNALYLGHCVTACPANTYPSLNGGIVCVACTVSNCLNCLASGCVQCQFPYTGVGCNSCVSGYYFSISVCIPCDKSCLSCTSASTCTNCVTGYLLINSQCLTGCPQGFYSNGTACPPCNSSCLSCTTSTGCTACANAYLPVAVNGALECVNSCPSGYYSDTTQCIQCSISCLTCTSSFACSLCSSPTYLYQGSCLAACPVGYTSTGTVCTPCKSGCKACTPTHCQSCLANLVSQPSGACVMPSNNCSSTQYLSSSKCLPCYSTCASCSSGGQSDCLSCPTGALLNGGACVSVCVNSYLLGNGSCSPCATKYPNCLQCDQNACYQCVSTYILNATSLCIQTCPVGTYQSDFSCLNCPSYCKTCSNSTYCQACTISGIVFINHMCYNTCPNGTYISGSNCLPCNSSCSICSTTSTNCSLCNLPYFLYEFSCVLACPSSTYPTLTYQCLACTLNCITCSSTGCQKCGNSFNLLNGSCVGSCPNGMFTNNGVCSNCLAPCSNCTSATVCVSCLPNLSFLAGKCTNGCQPGQYRNATNICTNCAITNCLYCNASACLSCTQATFATLVNSSITSCSGSCGDGFFGNSNTFQCQACGLDCLHCLSATTCSECDSATVLLSGSCLPTCPVAYYNSSSVCQPCSRNCQVCTNNLICTLCNLDYFFLASNISTCVTPCPMRYTNPILTDGTAICIPCPSHCVTCIDSLSCTLCESSTFTLVNLNCIPYNCVNCELCHIEINACTRCSPPYYLFGSRCIDSCPNGYYADSNFTCNRCMDNCLLCLNGQTCEECMTNYIFTGICEDWSVLTYGVAANMSGFTSNITDVVSKVYISTSIGPTATGEMASTYFSIEFCQLMFFHNDTAGGNKEMQAFLQSLQSVSLTTSNTPSSTSNNTAGRLLAATEYTSNFLATNTYIFIIMGSFLLAYITVTLFQRYLGQDEKAKGECLAEQSQEIDHLDGKKEKCCPRAMFYTREIMKFIQMRFKWAYFDFCMWISYLPFVYFSLLQLQNMRFDSGINGISSLLAVVIIVAYPLYPIFIAYLIKDKLNELVESEISENRLLEMSLGPYMKAVKRPGYWIDQDASVKYEKALHFTYFSWTTAILFYSPLKYIRKLLFVGIVALSSNPIATLTTLVTLNCLFIIYLLVMRPRKMPYLLLDLIIEFVLLFFEVFMLIYIAINGSQVAIMSIITHILGFLMANLTLIGAIIINVISYYFIIKCFYDLCMHLKEQGEIKDKQELKQEEEKEEREEAEQIVDHDKEIGGGGKNKIHNSAVTEENQEEDEEGMERYEGLGEKDLMQMGVNPIKIAKLMSKMEEEIPGLKDSSIVRPKRHRKKQKEEQGSKGLSKVESDDGKMLIDDGVVVERGIKPARNVGPDVLHVADGLIKEKTANPKFRRNIPKKDETNQKLPEQQSSMAEINLKSRQPEHEDEPDLNVKHPEIKMLQVIPPKIEDNKQKRKQDKKQDQKQDKKQGQKHKIAKQKANQDLINFDLFEEEVVEKEKAERKVGHDAKKGILEREKEMEDGNTVERHKKPGNKLYKESDDEKELAEAVTNEKEKRSKQKQSKGAEIANQQDIPKGSLFDQDPKKKQKEEQAKKEMAPELPEGDLVAHNLRRKNRKEQRDAEEPKVQELKIGEPEGHLVDQERKKRKGGQADESKPKEDLNEAYLVEKGLKRAPGKEKPASNEDQSYYSLKEQPTIKAPTKPELAKDHFDELMKDQMTDSIAMGVVKKERRDEGFEDEESGYRQKKAALDLQHKKAGYLMGSEEINEEYEQIKRKNKDDIIKPSASKKTINVEDEEFDEQEYSRPASKRESARSPSKKGALGFRDSSDASDNQSGVNQVRKRRNSAIQRLKKKDNLGVNSQAEEMEEDNMRPDSRRASKIQKMRNPKSGVLRINASDDEDGLEHFQL